MRKVLYVLPLVLLLQACPSIPPGYETLRDEVTILQISGYIQSMREGYIKAKVDGAITTEQFVTAVKADESLAVAWNGLVDAKLAGEDTAALWNGVIARIALLEEILRQWLPAATFADKPQILGGV